MLWPQKYSETFKDRNYALFSLSETHQHLRTLRCRTSDGNSPYTQRTELKSPLLFLAQHYTDTTRHVIFFLLTLDFLLHDVGFFVV